MALTLADRFAQLVATRATTRLVLSNGHELLLRLSTLGEGWVAGETLGHERGPSQTIGVVVPMHSVASLTPGSLPVWEPQSNVVNAQPLAAMIQNLAMLRKSLTLHGHNRRWNGFLVEGCRDHLVLAAQGGQEVIVPYRAIIWIHVS